MSCKCITKNMEIRWCDTYEEIYNKAINVRDKYYKENINI
jgi:hypothetical protein